MKISTKLAVSVAILALLTVASGRVQAQVTNIVTISISASAQGASSDNGTITTTANPSKHKLATKDLLAAMSQAENAAGHYGSPTFPSGAKLVAIGGNDGVDFQVLGAQNNLLVDVSNILTAANGTYDVSSGKTSDLTYLAAPSTTDQQILTLQYDDTGITGSEDVKFNLIGLMTNKTTDSAPKSGVYTQSESHTMTGIGEGNYEGTPIVLTGSLSAAGKATLPLNP